MRLRHKQPMVATPLPPDPPPARSLQALAVQEQQCRRCDLYRNATQAVPGRGVRESALMLVGEQPGDREDLAGEPFVGPAGRVLAQAMSDAGIDPSKTFVTNAVKHFKFELRGKRRLHKTPNVREIEACHLWLEREIALVQPQVIVALGASAARALLRRRVVLGNERGVLQPFGDGRQLMVTVHPSYLVRLRDAQAKAAERGRLVDELRVAVLAS
jgi:uracil-DNA glycosylase